MTRAKLDDDCRAVITAAQNMLAGVQTINATLPANEGPETMKFSYGDTIGCIKWTLGRKIPRLARAGRASEARMHLALAQGMLLGCGAITRHELWLISEHPPAKRQPAEGRTVTACL